MTFINPAQGEIAPSLVWHSGLATTVRQMDFGAGRETSISCNHPCV